MDPNVIIISDDELDEPDDQYMPNDVNENLDPLSIIQVLSSDEDENSKNSEYEVTTPEDSCHHSTDIYSISDDSQSGNSEELSSNKYESSSGDDYNFNTNTLKRKLRPKSKRSLNTDDKKNKIEPEVETSNITTVREMIVQCKKTLTSSFPEEGQSSNSKNTLLLEGELCSEDVSDKLSMEMDSDFDSFELNRSRIEISSNDVSNGSGYEYKSVEGSDNVNSIENELNEFSDITDINILQNNDTNVITESSKDDLSEDAESSKDDLSEDAKGSKNDLSGGAESSKNDLSDVHVTEKDNDGCNLLINDDCKLSDSSKTEINYLNMSENEKKTGVHDD